MLADALRELTAIAVALLAALAAAALARGGYMAAATVWRAITAEERVDRPFFAFFGATSSRPSRRWAGAWCLRRGALAFRHRCATQAIPLLSPPTSSSRAFSSSPASSLSLGWARRWHCGRCRCSRLPQPSSEGVIRCCGCTIV